jgi:uncharacterized protein YhaN
MPLSVGILLRALGLSRLALIFKWVCFAIRYTTLLHYRLISSMGTSSSKVPCSKTVRDSTSNSSSKLSSSRVLSPLIP